MRNSNPQAPTNKYSAYIVFELSFSGLGIEQPRTVRGMFVGVPQRIADHSGTWIGNSDSNIKETIILVWACHHTKHTRPQTSK